MIRAILFLLIAGALAALAVAAGGDAGRVQADWLGWRLDASAAAVLLLIGVLTLLAVVFWRVTLWLAEAPRRAERAREEARRREADAVLARGFLALAAGDGDQARRQAARAADLYAEPPPPTVALLKAQAAEAAHDPSAEPAWRELLDSPETRLAARRGLMRLSLARGDRDAALEHAEAALALSPGARWAWRALFEARVAAGDWDGALALVETGLSRKAVTPAAAARARAALLAASAARLEGSSDARGRAAALDQAQKALKQNPAFTPGPVIAARLNGAAGKLARAEEQLLAGWAAAPHPALALMFRDLRSDETPKERARRLEQLIARAPDHRESRFVALDRALLLGEAEAIDAASRALAEETPTRRLCGIMARAMRALDRPDEARAWLALGASAPEDPAWSDIDPGGRAFAYGQSDWARLVSDWTETGALAHPRHERGEPVLSELPDLPAGYVESAEFLAAAETLADIAPPSPDDPGDWDEDIAEPPPAPPPPARRRSPRRPPRTGAG